jgi:hypothetical protein
MKVHCLCLLLVTGCEQSTWNIDGQEVSASARCRPDNVVTADIDFTLPSAGSMRVLFGSDAQYGESTPARLVPVAGKYRLPLLGLRPGATTHLRVELTPNDGEPIDSGDLTVDCPALPDGFPSFTQVTGQSPQGGYLFITVANPKTNVSVAAVVDQTGRLFWYRVVKTLGEAKQSPDGDLVFYDEGRYTQQKLDGTVVRTWVEPRASAGTDNHEIVLLPEGRALLFGLNDRPPLLENTIAEVDGDGAVAFHWSGADHIGTDETTADIDFNKPPVDVHHANAMELLSDGHLLISLRHTDALYKVDRSNGDISWRLGGNKSDFTFVSDPLNGFSHQHYARQLAGGDILLLDNGNLHTPPVSRVVQYRLDETSHTATLVWEHRHRASLFSFCCGSTVRLPTGNTLTAWGSTGIIDEVDADHNSLWEMTIPDSIIYRAQPLASLAP